MWTINRRNRSNDDCHKLLSYSVSLLLCLLSLISSSHQLPSTPNGFVTNQHQQLLNDTNTTDSIIVENRDRLVDKRSSQSVLSQSQLAERRTIIADAVSPRRLFDFVTDPSLIITILHSLEVAYWSFPFGFMLMPVINFFRVPNKRIGKDTTSSSQSLLNNVGNSNSMRPSSMMTLNSNDLEVDGHRSRLSRRRRRRRSIISFDPLFMSYDQRVHLAQTILNHALRAAHKKYQ